MNASVIGKDDGSGILIPVALSTSEIDPKGINNRPIESFHLPIRLGKIGRGENLLDPEFSANGLKELRSELRSIVREHMAGWPVAEHPVFTERLLMTTNAVVVQSGCEGYGRLPRTVL
jgi:hypothetical protein